MTLIIGCRYAKCHYGECYNYLNVMPNLFMLSVAMLNVVMLSVVTPFDCQILPEWGTFKALLTSVGSRTCAVKHYGFVIY